MVVAAPIVGVYRLGLFKVQKLRHSLGKTSLHLASMQVSALVNHPHFENSARQRRDQNCPRPKLALPVMQAMHLTVHSSIRLHGTPRELQEQEGKLPELIYMVRITLKLILLFFLQRPALSADSVAL